jgi:hypothetical protein
VGAHPKDLENPPRKPLDVLLLGHHLRGQQGHPICVRVFLDLQDQSVIKRMPRTHPDSVFDDPHMDGKIIS